MIHAPVAHIFESAGGWAFRWRLPRAAKVKSARSVDTTTSWRHHPTVHQRLQQEIELALERSLARQRWRVDGAKVVMIFATAAAASLAGPALQSDGATPLTIASSITLALATLGLLAAIVADRIREPDVMEVLADAKVRNLSDQETADELFRRLYQSVTFNESVVNIVLGVSVVQVAVSAASGTLAVLAMLTGASGA